ncbi:hypothetical protein WS96_05455 [Burkholderia sp. MSMB1835]|nr:hypothetical protein WS96_05455 [Burkholderia sp. MSMB1835]
MKRLYARLLHFVASDVLRSTKADWLASKKLERCARRLSVRDVDSLARWAAVATVASIRLQGDLIALAHAGLAKVVRSIATSVDVVVAVRERSAADVRQNVLTAAIRIRLELLVFTLESGKFLVQRAHILRRLECFLGRHQGSLVDFSELDFKFGGFGSHLRFVADTERVFQKLERGVCRSDCGDK